MRLAKLAAIIAIVSPAASFLPDVDAQASEWGCEVLLCASSSNPSWRGVPACHPPMNRSDLRDERLGIYMADMS